MNALENRILPLIVALASAISMWLAISMFPQLRANNSYNMSLAILFIFIGVAILCLGAVTLRRSKTTTDPLHIDRATTLVTQGVFSYTRNPMYVGFTSLLIGIAFYLSSWWLLVAPVFFALFINRFQILPEERVMSLKFGNDYNAYKSKVRRWF